MTRFRMHNLVQFELVNEVISRPNEIRNVACLLAWWVVCDDQDEIEDKNQLKTNMKKKLFICKHTNNSKYVYI
jgi:hypothetical protein